MAITDDDTEWKLLVQRKMQIYFALQGKNAIFHSRIDVFPSRNGIFPSETTLPETSKGLVLSLKTRLTPIRLYMKDPSFRDILAQFLEGNDPDSPLKPEETKRFQPEPMPLLEWKSGDFQLGKKNGYPPPPSRKPCPRREEKPARPVVPEIFFTREQLPALAKDAVATLLALGAVELSGDVSVARLKKAHRRLAKALHPDLILESLSEIEKRRRREQFLLLQGAYEALTDILKSLTPCDPQKGQSGPQGTADGTFNDSASGSESASAPGSRRRDAA